ncbi:hypothetical protein SUGI_0534610 [Cryptomeria japonica]|uniref:uncharacterized protein LOC131037266 isoform X3 n=1 Tax=Cryptomeria japonica TaxID=3369 RepID=UPI002408EA3C|nr:uncharacterized protein LOC131037266 isoform X3 [Cryptomeria japonica]GLJ27249.1 hypothetical protein SUGI_0534610 [Cryptomeria japonica]
MGDEAKEASKEGISPFGKPSALPFDLFKQLKTTADGPSIRKFQPKLKARNSAQKSSSAKVQKKMEKGKSKNVVLPKVEEPFLALKKEVPNENLCGKHGDSVMMDVAKRGSEAKLGKMEDVEMGVKIGKTGEGNDEAFAKPGEDKIVREIDVYFTPAIDRDTKIYLMQYPLRPYWRPYGLKEKCEEVQVRVKPNQARLEVDLVMDKAGENYDHNAIEHLKITKQTLTSSKSPLSTSYVLGILQENKLHLSPVHSALQLRPLISYVNKREEHKKTVFVDEEYEEEPNEAEPKLVPLKVQLKKETELQEKLRLQSYTYFKQLDEAEPWIPLEAHGIDSPVTDGIRQKIVAVENFEIPFNMNQYEYVNKLVSGRRSTGVNKENFKEYDRNERSSRSMDSKKPSFDDVVQYTKFTKVVEGDQVARRGAAIGDMPERMMSEETRAALPGVLREILANRVCKWSQILQSLQNFAKEKLSARKLNSKALATAVAASKVASAPEDELKIVIDQIATNMNGVYFLSSVGNNELDPFRNVVIELLSKDTSRAIRKMDITKASKKALGREVSKSVYSKVMKELCTWTGDGWVLKTGE